MKNVTELKDGMKVWIPFEVEEVKGIDTNYSFRCVNDSVVLLLTKDCKNLTNEPPLEMYEQEEMPTLTPVEMEVSYDNTTWEIKNIIGKFKERYMDETGCLYNYGRIIQKKVTLEIPESELTDELRKYLKR